jgi:hypothetical protein
VLISWTLASDRACGIGLPMYLFDQGPVHRVLNPAKPSGRPWPAIDVVT